MGHFADAGPRFTPVERRIPPSHVGYPRTGAAGVAVVDGQGRRPNANHDSPCARNDTAGISGMQRTLRGERGARRRQEAENARNRRRRGSSIGLGRSQLDIICIMRRYVTVRGLGSRRIQRKERRGLTFEAPSLLPPVPRPEFGQPETSANLISQKPRSGSPSSMEERTSS
jgi:hypothetical protein